MLTFWLMFQLFQHLFILMATNFMESAWKMCLKEGLNKGGGGGSPFDSWLLNLRPFDGWRLILQNDGYNTKLKCKFGCNFS